MFDVEAGGIEGEEALAVFEADGDGAGKSEEESRGGIGDVEGEGFEEIGGVADAGHGGVLAGAAPFFGTEAERDATKAGVDVPFGGVFGAISGGVIDIGGIDASGEGMGFPPLSDLEGEHAADIAAEGEVVEGDADLAGVGDDPSGDGGSDGIVGAMALDFEGIAALIAGGAETAFEAECAAGDVLAGIDVAVVDAAVAEENFGKAGEAFGMLGGFMAEAGIADDALVVPFAGVAVLGEAEFRADGDDAGGFNAAGEEGAGVVVDLEGFGAEEDGIGVGGLIDMDADVVEAEAFEDGEIGAADFDAAAEDFGEIGLGHDADAIGVGEVPVGTDDDAEKDEEEEHADAASSTEAGAEGVAAAPAAVEGGFEMGSGAGHGW